jgi:peptide subunit release factor 1 (eRF1)
MSTTLSPQERDALVAQFHAMEEEAPFRLLTPGEVKLLNTLASDDAPIVSVYLDLGPEARRDRTWATVLKSLAREVTATITDPREARRVAQEVARIEQMLSQRLPDLGRSMALFSSEAIGLWHEVMLPVGLPNRLRFGKRAYLRPLFRVLDEHERFVIVVLDAQRARLFVSQLGSTVEVADLIEEGPSRHHEDGWVQMRLERQRDAHVLWHAGAVAHAAGLALEHFGARWLLVSGTADVLADFRQQLPQAVAARLAGEFRIAATASLSEVGQAVAAIERDVEAREELVTIERLGNARPGGRGVWGLEDTLRALNEMRVMTLVVQHDYRTQGGVCVDSGDLTANPIGLCPHCGEAVTLVEDVVEMALERAYRQSAQLEMVRSAAGLSRLEDYSPIGALLRF